MENFPKKRGRPRKIPEPMGNSLTDALAEYSSKDQGFLREYLGVGQSTERTHANTYYADRAREALEALSNKAKKVRGSGVPHDPLRLGKMLAGYAWILSRKTVLAELGRMMDADGELTQEIFDRQRGVIDHVAERHDKLTAKAAVAYVRGRRMGETKRKDRVASLHHNLNVAINLHRQRFPESTWPDIKQALELTTKQVDRKVG